MRAGRLRHRIDIYLPTKSSGVSSTETLNYFGTFWCAIEPMSGKEFQALGGTTNSLTTKITMRYVNNLTEAHIAIYKGRRFKFQQIINKEELNRELQIIAEEVIA